VVTSRSWLTGLLVREEDVFRSGRSRYRIAEPLVTFYEAVLGAQVAVPTLNGGPVKLKIPFEL
jgi:DnaJ-class molecular chaperone